ncbi:hypothetical protein DAPPUDRAFT_98614 [Daphnia pulex]|uniref:Uncharacterized protein n=1 Tax=Daphnia pulex TaxID=6669 RepID=E9G5A3_DAPPU|nr:hypothetical protein DAPPUDRAFT_98614 [Daphnia pulex]|eukprot:EFX85667.1 hypothetical protein DAPPUDRAFT_98614 [Daphnia pulex]
MNAKELQCERVPTVANISTRCTNTNVVNFVLGSMELAQVAVTGLLRCLDISLEEYLWGIVTHTRVNLQTGRPVCPDRMSFSLEGHEKHYVKLACDGVEVGSIPSNVILQKERPVCMSIEGHGDH